MEIKRHSLQQIKSPLNYIGGKAKLLECWKIKHIFVTKPTEN